MSREQSGKNRYPSIYSPNGWVRADQYIIELICEKKAKLDKKDLPVKFWNDPDWAKFFKSQLRKCKSLLEFFKAEAIIKALQDKRTWNIYSLHAPWLPKIIDEYNKKIIKTIVKENDDISTGDKFIRNKRKSKNIIDLLDE